jgi:hypothetical protein
MNNFAPKLDIMLLEPMWMYSEDDKKILSSLLLICDKIIMINLSKHSIIHNHTDKPKGFFSSFGHRLWCDAAWSSGILEEPKGIEDIITQEKNRLLNIECNSKKMDRAYPYSDWVIDPQELIIASYLKILEKQYNKLNQQIYPLTRNKNIKSENNFNSAIMAHYYLANAALSIAMPSLPIFDDSEQILEIRNQCLKSGELEEFQSMLRKITEDLSILHENDTDIKKIEDWAKFKAETTIRLSLHSLNKKINDLKGVKKFSFLKNKKFISSMLSIISLFSWITLLKEIISNCPTIYDSLETLVFPENKILSENKGLAYLYRLSKHNNI